MAEVGRFLAMIGAVIRRPVDGRYLVVQRSAMKDFAAGVWEVPSGRLDQGEGFVEALHREVWEETGLRVGVDFIVGLTHFYRGTAVAENEMVGVMFACTAQEPIDLQLSVEHSRADWVTPEEVGLLVPEDDWLTRLLVRDGLLRENAPESLLNIHRQYEYIT